jgi:hypothetical protein
VTPSRPSPPPGQSAEPDRLAGDFQAIAAHWQALQDAFARERGNLAPERVAPPIPPPPWYLDALPPARQTARRGILQLRYTAPPPLSGQVVGRMQADVLAACSRHVCRRLAALLPAAGTVTRAQGRRLLHDQGRRVLAGALGFPLLAQVDSLPYAEYAEILRAQPVGELEEAAPEQIREFLRLLPRRRLWFHLARAVVGTSRRLLDRVVGGELWFPPSLSCTVEVGSLAMTLAMPPVVAVETTVETALIPPPALAAEPLSSSPAAEPAGAPEPAVSPAVIQPPAVPAPQKQDRRRHGPASEWHRELEKHRAVLNQNLSPRVSQDEFSLLLGQSRRRLYGLNDQSDPRGEQRRAIVSALEKPARDLAEEVRRHRASHPPLPV